MYISYLYIYFKPAREIKKPKIQTNYKDAIIQEFHKLYDDNVNNRANDSINGNENITGKVFVN